MDEQDAQPHTPQLDYGEALRKVRAMRRCLPAIGIHWIKAGHQHCQCGKTFTMKPQADRKNA